MYTMLCVAQYLLLVGIQFKGVRTRRNFIMHPSSLLSQGQAKSALSNMSGPQMLFTLSFLLLSVRADSLTLRTEYSGDSL